MAGNIKQFESPIGELHPNEGGISTIARMGRIEKSNYDEAGRAYGDIIQGIGKDVDNYEYSQELSQGAASLALIHNNMTTAWNKTAAATDPNDDTIQQKFMDSAEDQLNHWSESFQTRRGQDWAQSQVNSIRTHLWEKTSADMGIRAGEAAVGNLKTGLTSLADLAGKDFTTIDHSLEQIDTMVAAQGEAGYLNQKQRDAISSDMKNELVKAGLKGLADRQPQQATALIASGHFDDYISKTEGKQLVNYAKVQEHAREVDQQRAAEAKSYAHEQKISQVNMELVGQTLQGKPPSAAQIVANTDLPTEQKAIWIGKDGILSMPENALRSPQYGNDFGKVADAFYSGNTLSDESILGGVRDGHVTLAGAAQLQKLNAMRKTPEGLAELNAQKPVLTLSQAQIVKGGSGASDPQGQQLYNQFLQSFYQAWDAGLKKGSTPAQLADPNSKDYLGNLAAQFKRSDAQAIADVTKVQQAKPVVKPAEKSAVKHWIIKDGNLVPAGGQ